MAVIVFCHKTFLFFAIPMSNTTHIGLAVYIPLTMTNRGISRNRNSQAVAPSFQLLILLSIYHATRLRLSFTRQLRAPVCGPENAIGLKGVTHCELYTQDRLSPWSFVFSYILQRRGRIVIYLRYFTPDAVHHSVSRNSKLPLWDSLC